MKKNLIHFSIACFAMIGIMLFQGKAYAQTTSPFYSYLYLQPNIGVAQYFGDYNPDNLFNKNPQLAGGGILGYQITPVLGIRTQFTIGKLYSKSQDFDRILNSKFWDFSGQLTLNVNNMFNYNPNRAANLYLFGGGGYFNTNSKVTTLNDALVMENIKDGAMFPAGVGLAFRISDATDFNIEYGHRFTLKDDKIDFFANRKNDSYSYLSLGVTFKALVRDADGDGISDKEDLCPNEKGPLSLGGCPDRDNDGIADKDDECPDVAGLAALKGCPDRDGDSIADKNDACPDVAGLAQFNGCPDTDGDGIMDKDDACPNMAGLAQFNGCPDTDGDGIPDKDDACPDVAGLAKYKGCPVVDTDGDGVPDDKDRCPKLAGPASNEGCPKVSEEVITKINYAAKQIQFQTGKAILLTASKRVLNEVATILKNDPNLKLKIDGHTDNVGNDDYNLKLSDARAAAVRAYLLEQGIDGSRMQSQGFGEGQPIDTNNTAAGRAINRRVELHLNY